VKGAGLSTCGAKHYADPTDSSEKTTDQIANSLAIPSGDATTLQIFRAFRVFRGQKKRNLSGHFSVQPIFCNFQALKLYSAYRAHKPTRTEPEQKVPCP
jgi:hypothetical protein